MTKPSFLHLAVLLFLLVTTPNLHAVSAQSNTKYGAYALDNNTTGFYNSAFGYAALYRNSTTNASTAVGAWALYSNKYGAYNTAIGVNALYSNSSGSYNTASGYYALYANTASYNVAIGYHALRFNTSGHDNVALGVATLYSNTTGSYNTAIGDQAGPSTSGLSNTTALGNGATTKASNQVRIGNSSVTSIGGYASWSKLSDGRYKKNVKEDVPGLAFITQLRPVTYTVDVEGLDKALNKDLPAIDDKESQSARPTPSAEEIASKAASAQVIHTGFMAQEVEEIAKKLQYEFSGIDKPKNNQDFYGLRYAEFVVPLVKAVQELNFMNKQLKEEVDALRSNNEQLEQRLEKLEALITMNNMNAAPFSSAYLEQSTPNPTTGAALIRYYVPQNSRTANMVFTDMKGAIIKSITISNKGNGQLNVNTAAWTAGTYTYTLYINGTQTDSKKLVVAR
ncbi:tail fiber domain-containing protein [Chitinophagaceae bacterium LB-8]|uniref:Tail fiber domain-containing protein n=1 Tax=Paraflavisolibacter caeni TaxID=2982496 RepID=A0A9X2XSX7_9BACT|nr:tail fiber domain-containing protein [Paraflavisolibacter caeni]MCU7548175.1 tail fiber domain-containing protein [Paraflavisolibacter caeni]